MGILSLAIGVSVFLYQFLLFSPESAIQQIVQYLGFACASIFIAAAFVIFYFQLGKTRKKEREVTPPLEPGWRRCPDCKQPVAPGKQRCPDCGYRM